MIVLPDSIVIGYTDYTLILALRLSLENCSMIGTLTVS